MINYIDASALLRFLTRHETAIELTKIPGDFVSSELLKLECRRALIRYRLNLEIDDSGLVELTGSLNDLFLRISFLRLDSNIIEMSSRNWGIVLGSLDSIHLASVLLIQQQSDQPIQMITHDKALFAASRLMNLNAIGL